MPAGTREVGFGLLGCGMIASLHARALRRVPGARLVAVADAVTEYAVAFAERYGVVASPDYSSLLAHPEVDAVTLCTPSGMHADQGILAARAGVHVLSEKPMALDVHRVDALIAECRAHGVTLGGVFQNRFPASVRAARAAVAEGRLGDIVFAAASCLWHRPQSYYDSSAWRGTRDIDGGVLANQSIHTLDRLIWLTGMQPRVVSAYCATLQRRMEAEDLGVALLCFPNGAAGVVEATTLAVPGFPARVTLCGTRGSLIVENNTVTHFQALGVPADLLPVGNASDAGGASDPMAIPEDDHVANITEFVAAIRDGREPLVGGAEARKAVELLCDIYAAAGISPRQQQSRDS